MGDEHGNEYEDFTATPPGACTPDGALSVGTARQGVIEEGDCAQFPDDRYDRWTLALDADTDVRIDMRSGSFDTMLELLGAHGRVIAVNDDAYGTLNSRIVTFLPRGSYDVIARTYAPGMRGSYDIGVEVAEGCQGAEIVLGQEFTGEVTAADCLVDQWMPADSFSLTLPEDTRLDFVTKSTDFRPLLLVRDERRWDVFAAYDQNGTGTAQGRATLAAGSYVVYVLPDGQGLGSYQLLVEEVACEAPRPVIVGGTVEGTLDESDCVRDGGAFRDVWSLELDTERSLQIDMASEDLDAWLSVKDEDGVEIAHDDDSGPGFDAALGVTLSPGRYTVLASSFGPNDVGDYSLSVVAGARYWWARSRRAWWRRTSMLRRRPPPSRRMGRRVACSSASGRARRTVHEAAPPEGRVAGQRARPSNTSEMALSPTPAARAATSTWYTRSAASSGIRSASPFARAVTSSAHSSPSFFRRRFSSVRSFTV
jgi:hypothetical protein